MMNFCTLFDSYYIHKGIALYLSLEKVTNDFHLYVMAFDRDCYDKLKSLAFKSMTVELLDDFETPELLAVKPTRNKAEYCWTAGPSVIYYFLTKYRLDKITYLDSDLFFLSDPRIIEEEACESSIVITEQGISEIDASRYGKYCVQYMTFKNDKEGLEALTWWRDSCIEWCFQIMEPTRYADQKYLDQFPIRWKSVCVIENRGAGIAPWNMKCYEYNEHSLIYKGKRYPLVFFHMHGIAFNVNDKTMIASTKDYSFNPDVLKLFFSPYVDLIAEVFNKYLDKKVVNVKIKDISFIKKVEYRIRALVKQQEIFIKIYFKFFKKKNIGHGTYVP